jgi:hypothetical protein
MNKISGTMETAIMIYVYEYIIAAFVNLVILIRLNTPEFRLQNDLLYECSGCLSEHPKQLGTLNCFYISVLYKFSIFFNGRPNNFSASFCPLAFCSDVNLVSIS